MQFNHIVYFLSNIFSDDDINAMFEEVLEALAIPEKKRAEMMSTETMERKWKLIVQQQALLQDEDASDAHDWALLLKEERDYPSRADARQLTAVIRTSPKKWLQTFFKQDGGTSLLRILRGLALVSEIASNELEVVMELLFSIKAMMNNIGSMTTFVMIPQSLDTIACCLRLGIEEVSMICLELLTAAAFFSVEGQQLTVKAMDSFRLVNREYSRFTSLVHILKHASSMDLKVSVLTFINYLVNCEELDERVSIRNDFLQLNLIGVCREIIEKGEAPEIFSTQMEVFEQLTLEDAAIVNYEGVRILKCLLFYGLIIMVMTFVVLLIGFICALLLPALQPLSHTNKFNQLDLSSIDQLFVRVKENVAMIGLDPAFLSLMHRLVAIPTDHIVGSGMWEALVVTLDRIITLNPNKALANAKIVKYEDLAALIKETERLANASGLINDLDGMIVALFLNTYINHMSHLNSHFYSFVSFI